MRNIINATDNVLSIIEELISAKCRSKTFDVLDEHGFLIKIRVDIVGK